jgi:hypothetical protein
VDKKLKTMRTTVFFSVIISSLFFFSCEKSGLTEPSTAHTLEIKEAEDLQFMREEEKLARDVYQYAYDQYQLQIFKNISASEQKHMDAVAEMLDKYGVEDPALPSSGLFNNPDLEALYNQLTEQVDINLVEALKVGATIEDLDIKDLKEAADRTQRSDLQTLYNQLACGSENHMRAFYGQIQSRGGSYTPQFISVEVFNDIISAEHGHCGQ